jgi:antitoxin HicB
MSQIYKLPLILDPQPEGGWTITCPLLPGLVTEADAMNEVLPNVTDALQSLIEMYKELNQPLPTILQPDNDNKPLWTETLIELKAA